MIDRQELHRLTDHVIEEDEDFNDKTKQEIREGLKEYQHGEFVTLAEHSKRGTINRCINLSIKRPVNILTH